jgi:hypothetical protein
MKEDNMQQAYKLHDELFDKGQIRNAAGKLINVEMESKDYQDSNQYSCADAYYSSAYAR